VPRCSGVPTRGNRYAQGDDRPGRRVDVARILCYAARAIGSGLIVGCLVAPPRESRTRPAVTVAIVSAHPRKHGGPRFAMSGPHGLGGLRGITSGGLGCVLLCGWPEHPRRSILTRAANPSRGKTQNPPYQTGGFVLPWVAPGIAMLTRHGSNGQLLQPTV
jgi:hypothetical protein